MIAESRGLVIQRRLAQARALAGEGAALPQCEGGYTRTQLFVCEEYEIVGFRWAPASTTQLHDHGVSHCATLLLQGELHVERFTYDEASATFHDAGVFTMTPGSVDDANDDGEFHRVTAGGEAAVTVHVYAPPLGVYRAVDADSGELVLAAAAFTRV